MIDGAHNNESVKVLIDLLQSEHADKEIELLFAAIDTKPIDGMLAQVSAFEIIPNLFYPFLLAVSSFFFIAIDGKKKA